MNQVNAFRRLRSEAPQRGDDLSAVVQRVARGDETAFAELYDLTSGLVHGIARRVIRNPALAEEITQEVFVEIWRHAPRFDADRGSPKSWIAAIAHRRAVDRVRAEDAASKRNARHEHQDRPPAAQDPVAEDVADGLERARVEHALRKLSTAQREAIELAYYGGHTYREVAALLDVAEGTVKTRIRDGLIKLRDQFGVSA